LDGCVNLHLNEGLRRKLSEVQTYMTLYYESRIRQTILERWAKDKITQLEIQSNPGLEIPEDEILPEESAIFKDMMVPISFKNTIAQELWEKEEEAIKRHVRSKRDAQVTVKTVYNTEGEERSELLRQYIK
jgi:hypothetical protein